MKIVLISPAHPLRGGIAASGERLAQALQDAGHEVVIYSFSLQYPAFLFPGKTQYTTDPPPAGLRIETRLNSVNPFNWLSVAWRIAREQPDQVVVRFWLPLMGPCLGSVVRLMRWFSNKKIKVTGLVDNIVPHEKRPGDRPFARYFVGGCDDFVVMSHSVGEEIRTFSRAVQEVRFAPHPVYDSYGAALPTTEARAALGIPADVGGVVLFFGLIRPYKGLDVLLRAVAGAAFQQQKIHVLVAGECYGDEATYTQLADELGLGDRTHFYLQYIANEAVAQFFSAADVVALPYKTATQSGVLQIAYHFNRPVVVTRVGGLPEMVEEGESGFVVPPNDPAAVADVLLRFFAKDPEALQAGVQRVKARFSWENLVRALTGMRNAESGNAE